MKESSAAQPTVAALSASQFRRWLYPALVVTIIAAWAIYMTLAGRWGLFREFWGLSVTMLFGSFIAGATPQGGSAVAFPVFTKVFQIPSPDARTFGLMIQSVGMTMASITILLRGVKVLPRVILWATVGGAIGIYLGTFHIAIPAPFPKVLFSLSLSAFGVALFISRWVIHWRPCTGIGTWRWGHTAAFGGIGIVGGIFAAYTGAGADALTFVVLTLAFGVDEKISTPTTVIIMALNSIIGFFLHGVVTQDIGIAWNFWLVTVPIVIIGAPLGSYVLSLISRDTLIIGILVLILGEAISTIILIPFTGLLIAVTMGAIFCASVCFVSMLRYRHYTLVDCPDSQQQTRLA